MGNMSITDILAVIIIVISLIAFNKPEIIQKYKHYPYLEKRNKEYHRMISSGFLHGGWLHLLINVFVLWQFGQIVENQYLLWFGSTNGTILYLLLFFLTIIAADMPTYIKHKDNPRYSSIGASGAVSGIVFVFILMAPWHMLYLYGILPIPAIVGGVAYLGYSQWASKHSRAPIDHDAHIYGALFGMLFTIILKPGLAIEFWSKFISIIS